MFVIGPLAHVGTDCGEHGLGKGIADTVHRHERHARVAAHQTSKRGCIGFVPPPRFRGACAGSAGRIPDVSGVDIGMAGAPGILENKDGCCTSLRQATIASQVDREATLF